MRTQQCFDPILLNMPDTKKCTVAESIEFFKDINQRERKLYQHSLSHTSLTRCILQHFPENNIIEVSNLIEYYSIDANLSNKPEELINKFCDSIRLVKQARDWLDNINNWIDNSKNILPDSDWKQEFKKQYQIISKLKTNFICNNHGLIHRLIRPYLVSERYSDLFQEGVIGLMMAMNRFDYQREIGFSTYGSWWIRLQLNIAVCETSTLVRLPSGIRNRVRKLTRLRELYMKTHASEPPVDWLAKESGYSEDVIDDVMKSWQLNKTISFDAPITSPTGEIGTDEVYSLFPDDENIDPVEAIFNHKLRLKLIKLIKRLSVREQYIIKNHFCVDECKTMEEIGVTLGVTRERIRQIQVKAISKIKENLPKDYI